MSKANRQPETEEMISVSGIPMYPLVLSSENLFKMFKNWYPYFENLGFVAINKF